MSARDLFGDSSSDEEEDNTAEPAPTASTAKPNNALDDDDDDDDIEFNDKEGVVGLSSTTMAGVKVKETEGPTTANDGEEAEAVTPDEESKTVIVIPEVERPPERTELFMTKLPNLVGIQTECFDPDAYSAKLEEDEFGKSAFNLMRWRYKTDQNGHLLRDSNDKLQRESNTRLVQWEDGSWTLHVGSECFEVDAIDSSNPKSGFAGLNGYLYMSQKAVARAEGGTEEAMNTVLECMGPIKSRMTVRPSSLQSEAHKSLTVAVRQKTIKRARIAEFATQEDPEKLKQERIKTKSELEKANQRKRRSGGYYQRSTSSRPRMSRDYMEEEDRDFDTTNIKDLKRRAGDYDDMDDYGDDDGVEADESDEETFNRRRPNRRDASRKAEKDSDEDIVMGDDEDEDDEIKISKPGKKRTSTNVFDDDDDSD